MFADPQKTSERVFLTVIPSEGTMLPRHHSTHRAGRGVVQCCGGAFRSERSLEGESERRTERTEPQDAAQRASPAQ